jgi:hypothetical protein
MDEDGDDKEEINKWKGSKQADQGYETLNNNYSKSDSPTLTEIEIEELKIKQTKRKKSKKLTREIVFNIIFLYVLFVACYSNRDDNSFSYGTHLKSIFQEYNDVILLFLFQSILFFDKFQNFRKFKITTVENFWDWISNGFIKKFNAKSYYNGQNYSNINLFLNDHSSILIGYPTIRQLRIQKGIEFEILYFYNGFL